MRRIEAMQPLSERMPNKRVTNAPVNLRPAVVVEDHSHPRVEDPLANTRDYLDGSESPKRLKCSRF